MDVKTILVHLADDEECERRLKVALKLAQIHNAHVTALFITKPLAMPAAVAGRAASSVFLESAYEASRARARRLSTEFKDMADRANVDHTWIVEDGEHLGHLRYHAHVSDLVVVSQINQALNFEDHFRVRLAEELVMDIGAPVLIVPRNFEAALDPKHVLVCWKMTYESVRAVRGSLAFLKRAELVTVLSIDESEESMLSATEVVSYLQRHGVTADAELVPSSDRSVADTLIEQAEQRRAQMMVMGAYGHSRMRELLFGGVTREMFQKMRLPVIMAH